jgi:hypothetical protein
MHDSELCVREILEGEVIHGEAGVRGVEARLRGREPLLGQP